MDQFPETTLAKALTAQHPLERAENLLLLSGWCMEQACNEITSAGRQAPSVFVYDHDRNEITAPNRPS